MRSTDRSGTTTPPTRRLLPLLLLALLIVQAPPASAAKVESEYDAEFDFSALHTFDWLPTGGPLVRDRTTDRQIRAAIEKRLAARGFEPAREGSADFLLHYDVGLRERMEVSGSELRLAEGSGIRLSFAWEEGVEARAYSEGSLVIEVMDAESREIVWVGWATDIAEDPRQLRGKLDRTVRRVLRRFPPS